MHRENCTDSTVSQVTCLLWLHVSFQPWSTTHECLEEQIVPY